MRDQRELKPWLPRQLPVRIAALLMVLLLLFASSSVAAEEYQRYAITLASSSEPFDPASLPHRDVLKKYFVYISRFSRDGKLWYRLRLGFFDSINNSKPALRQFRFSYPDAWISGVNDSEFAFAQKNRLTAGADDGPISDLEQARQALTRGDAAVAASLLQKIVREGGAGAAGGDESQAKSAREALELLAVAQERLGDNRAAIATYKDYLARYKEGEGSDRVRQRLIVLQTLVATPSKALPKPKKTSDTMSWNGSFSQFSNRDVRILDGGGTDISSTLYNNLNVSSRYRDARLEVRTQLDTSYRYRFNADNTTDDQLRLSSFYVDLRDKRYDTAARLGRQSASTVGILGRFDGAMLSYRAAPRWKYNLVAGYPVELSTTSIVDEKDRHFVGMGVDMGTFAKVWDLSVYAIDQQINGITDRQAVGGEARYSARNWTHLMLLDYDVSYSELNTFMALSNWFLPDQTSINAVVDIRAVPVLTTANALIGRTETGIDEMLVTLTEDEIRQLARDRTSRIYTTTLGVTHPLSDKYQINADVTAFNQTNTPASGGVPAVDNGGDQFIYSLTMIGSDVFKKDDISIASLRYSDTINAAISALTINVRYPLTNAWRAGPALTMDYRDNLISADQWSIRPSLHIDYHWLNNITFDAEVAALHIESVGPVSASDTDLFFELGYRVDF